MSARAFSGEAASGSPQKMRQKQKARAAVQFNRTDKGSTEPIALRAPRTLHASCVAIGERGVLIRGPSGAGKSQLALLLRAQARLRGSFAALVADDRVILKRRGGRLLASPHPAIAGRFEARGAGIFADHHEPRIVLCLVVDLEREVERLPATRERTTCFAGVGLPRLALVAGRVGLYEVDLVLDFVLMHQWDNYPPGATFRVGAEEF
jgi:HPr kinase/phosphorylase